MIGCKGAERIAAALQNNHTVTDLDLASNGIGSKGAARIVEALEKNTTVIHFTLVNNDMDFESADRIDVSLKRNTIPTSIVWPKANAGSRTLIKSASGTAV